MPRPPSAGPLASASSSAATARALVAGLALGAAVLALSRGGAQPASGPSSLLLATAEAPPAGLLPHLTGEPGPGPGRGAGAAGRNETVGALHHRGRCVVWCLVLPVSARPPRSRCKWRGWCVCLSPVEQEWVEGRGVVVVQPRGPLSVSPAGKGKGRPLVRA